MAPAPAPAPTIDVEEGGGGAKNQNSMAVVKSEDVSSRPAGGHPMVGVPDLVGANSEPVEDEGGDTTECSSSFGGTCSGFDDEADGAEPEVSSNVWASADGDLASRLPRKKKVTAEWRNAIRPIMWRCQWLELRMKDLSSQVSKYDRELALIEKEKELQQAVSKTDGSMPELMQICKGHGNSSMKRKKRKRHEDIVDTSLYIKKHQILSYYNDKQNKGTETDGLLIDDDCSNPVNGSITGGLDTAALFDAEEYDMIFEQATLTDILLAIDGVQSQVHLLQDRLSKARLEEEKLAFSEDNTHARVARKRQSTQRFFDMSYKEYRYTKPQKRKNLNILLKDDDGPPLAARPALPDRETNCQIENVKGNKGEKSGEWNNSRDRAITVDLLLGADSSLPNGHMGDLCRENPDDVLIDNEAANEGCQQFEKVKHLPSETSCKGQNPSAPREVKNTYAPVKVNGASPPLKVDNTSAPVVKQEPFLILSPMMKPVKKRGWIPTSGKKHMGSASSSKKQSKGASKTPDAKQKTESTPSSAKEKIGGTPSSAKEKTGGTPSGATDPETMTARSDGNKCKTGNNSGATKKRRTENSSSASKKQKTGNSFGNSCSASKKQKIGNSPSAAKKRKIENSSSAAKRQETENSSPAAKKQGTENSSPAANKQETENSFPAAKKLETESSPSKLQVEKAVLVAVNSRRSQRVRKPKRFTE